MKRVIVLSTAGTVAFSLAIVCSGPNALALNNNHGNSTSMPKAEDIQAICRIDMKRGPDIEGVILLGREYSYRMTHYWDPNGFYFTQGNGSSSAILFDKYYEYIKNGEITEVDPLYDSRVFGHLQPPPKPKDVIAWPEHDRVYFLYCTPTDDYVVTRTASFAASTDSSTTPLIYRSEFVERFKSEYQLLDYVPVYPRIPDEVAVRGAKSVKPILVPLREIDEFRILLRLSEKWAYEVDAARKRGTRNGVIVRWFNYSTLPEIRSIDLYSPWENRIPPDSSRMAVDRPHRTRPYDLQGICRIETVGGQVVEGAYLVASDIRPDEGNNNIPQTNGFYFADDRRGGVTIPAIEVFLFPLSFEARSFDSMRCVSSSGGRNYAWCTSSRTAKNYYLNDVTIREYGKGRLRDVRSEVVEEGSHIVLKRFVENRYPEAFEMLDCIPIWTEIPSEGSLRIATSVQPMCVPVSSIRNFETVSPDVLWLTRIERAELEALKSGRHRDDVRWGFGATDSSSIKSGFLFHPPRHTGLDLSNIHGYR